MSHHKILGMVTPKETFTGRKPNVSHFHIFVSIVYCHVSKDSKKNLESIVERGIFVGYTRTPHFYWVVLSLTQDDYYDDGCDSL